MKRIFNFEKIYEVGELKTVFANGDEKRNYTVACRTVCRFFNRFEFTISNEIVKKYWIDSEVSGMEIYQTCHHGLSEKGTDLILKDKESAERIADGLNRARKNGLYVILAKKRDFSDNKIYWWNGDMFICSDQKYIVNANYDELESEMLKLRDKVLSETIVSQEFVKL